MADQLTIPQKALASLVQLCIEGSSALGPAMRDAVIAATKVHAKVVMEAITDHGKNLGD